MGICFNQSQKILPLIESSIKKGNSNIESFSKNLLSNLLSNYNKENLIKYAIEKLSKKNIYYIRHAESEHNVLEKKYHSFKDYDKWNIYDPKLSPNGIEQTNNIKQKLKENKIHFGSVFISPLTRAMQTYELISDEINDDAEIIVTDFAREINCNGLDKNKGKELSKLKKENINNKKLNFNFMTKQYWWNDTGEKNDDESEDMDLFILRLQLFILWITFRHDENILIISHSNVFVNMQDSYGIYNADMKLLEKKDLQERILSLINDFE